MTPYVRSLIVLTTLAAVTALTQEPGGGRGVYQKAIKSLVWILGHHPNEPSADKGTVTGSGSLIDGRDRVVITNYHVIQGRKLVTVLFPVFDKNTVITKRDKYLDVLRNGGGISAEVIASDPKRDLALIRLQQVPAKTPVLRLAGDSVFPGDSVHSIGNAGASSGLWAYTPGSVKGITPVDIRPRGASFRIQAKMIETTSPVNRGDSGGPLLNGNGELVGVTQGHAADDAARSISYFIDLSEVKAFLKENKLGRILTASPAQLAADTTPAPPQPKTPPADPNKVKENTAAFKLSNAKALLKEGKKDRAREYLDEIIRDYPDTKAANEAKKLIDTLK